MIRQTRSIVDTEALIALVRETVRAELDAAGVASASYSSANLPPQTTARTFAAWCRSGRVAGAERDGRGWRCTATAWRDARSKGPAKPRVAEAANDVDALLAAAGLRGTR